MLLINGEYWPMVSLSQWLSSPNVLHTALNQQRWQNHAQTTKAEEELPL